MRTRARVEHTRIKELDPPTIQEHCAGGSSTAELGSAGTPIRSTSGTITPIAKHT